MLLIKKNQIVQLESVKKNNLPEVFFNLIKSEHPDLFSFYSENEWEKKIEKRLEEGRGFGIISSSFLFVYLLTVVSFRFEELPDWAIELLNWPGKSEEDKIVLLCKELYKNKGS